MKARAMLYGSQNLKVSTKFAHSKVIQNHAFCPEKRAKSLFNGLFALRPLFV